MTQRSRNSPKRSLPLARVYRLLEPEAVVKCGNVSGRRKDKFAAFGLTALQAAEVDTRLVTKYNFFVLEVCKRGSIPRCRRRARSTIAGGASSWWRGGRSGCDPA